VSNADGCSIPATADAAASRACATAEPIAPASFTVGGFVSSTDAIVFAISGAIVASKPETGSSASPDPAGSVFPPFSSSRTALRWYRAAPS
jgi:hypothetical protein